MKNIIICCDGTANDFGDKNSNVVKLFSFLKKDHEKQIVYYDPGVGTPSTYNSFNPITKKTKYAFGLAFGYGISQNIMEAYNFLMNNYKEGDKVFMFGFSRGAYTVRAVAGLIHTCGLMHDHNENLLPEVMRIYSDRNNINNEAFKEIFCISCPIHFLGLFDTVSSVGWVYNPTVLRSTTNNNSVKNVRHAVSIDERRAFFRQNLWGKKYREKQDVKEVWFAGTHSDIGGGYSLDNSALSNISLEWMVVEAMSKGILIEDIEKVKKVVYAIDKPHKKEHNQSLSGPWYMAEVFPKIVRKPSAKKSKWRSSLYLNVARPRFIKDKITLHESVIKRMEELPKYRPKNLIGSKEDVKSIVEKNRIEPWNPIE